MAEPTASTDILSLDAKGIAEALAGIGEPRYRAGQVIRWLHGRGVGSYDEMTDLPAALRERLAATHPLRRAQVDARQVSAIDDTRKYLVRLSDGAEVESVGLPAGDRLTVCFSTQAGCAMGCAFCATGLGGLVRNLSAGEMADQVRVVSQDFGRRVTNAVAMGQGEPFANYDAVLGGLRFLNSTDAFGIGARHITVSTCGLLGGIGRLAREPEQFTLAVSLHSARQNTRDRLMPGMRGVSLAELRETLADYADISGRRFSLEYALIDGVNDTAEEFAALASWCRGLLCHVNLIPANPVSGTGLARSESERTHEAVRLLDAAGVDVSVRAERGADIDAACGQLRQRASKTPAD
ncbi:MAG: 23S rRNA (adenine(2503)-C(2))-methyltransferase RlmN [Actinomycetota bacterium]|nr:23S rRNA (adenine(2503)-C(2))-methyltransferase RlmN [Actinomycetota bacterium]